MAAWGGATSGSNDDAINASAPSNLPTATVDPQAKGWANREPVDYESLIEKTVDSEYWGHARAKYDYVPEEGEDIGPRIPALEAQLFNFDHQVRVGDHFDDVQEVQVICEGPESVKPVKKFEDFGLHPIIEETVRMSRYLKPTPIQQYAIPAILKGIDVVAVAQTGSGKTGAYMIPVLSKLMGKAKKIAKQRPSPLRYDSKNDAMCAEPLVLIVCPTRELAIQIFDEARRLCYRSMLRPCVAYGGGPRNEQLADLQRGCDILIGTPGRLKDFLENSARWISLRRVRYTILDEADEMLDADWEDVMSSLLGGGSAQSDGQHQYMFFSATFPKVARDIAKRYLQDEYLQIKVGRIGSVPKGVVQDVFWVNEDLKQQALLDLILSVPPCRTLIFTNSTYKTDMIDDFLYTNNFPVTATHSGRTQREREDAINAFRTGKCPIMVASGLTSRGIDVINVMHIINYDLPSADHGGITEYVHRIGRTARMGNLGKSSSFYNDRNVDLALDLVKALMDTAQKIPDFLEEFKPEQLTWNEDDSDNEGLNDGGAAIGSGGGWGSNEGAAQANGAASLNCGGSGWESGGGGANNSGEDSRGNDAATNAAW